MPSIVQQTDRFPAYRLDEEPAQIPPVIHITELLVEGNYVLKTLIVVLILLQWKGRMLSFWQTSQDSSQATRNGY